MSAPRWAVQGAAHRLYMHERGRTRLDRRLGRMVLDTTWTADVDRAKTWATQEGAERFATTWAVYDLTVVEVPTSTPDEHGNRVAREGVDRCACGAKYWEHDRCVDCGAHVSEVAQ